MLNGHDHTYARGHVPKISTDKEDENLGTDFYSPDFKVQKTIPYRNNYGYIFTAEKDSWHGLEKKKIKKERRCIQINYVTFKTDWPVE